MRGVWFFAFILSVSACSQGFRSAKPSGVALGESSAPSFKLDPPQIVAAPASSQDGEFQLPEITLRCDLSYCPRAVGLLTFVWPIKNGGIQITECVATLIAKNEIVTNGHCDRLGEARGFFTTLDSKGHKVQRELLTVKEGSKVFTPGPSPDTLSDRPDAVVFKLKKPIENVGHLALASGPPKSEPTGFFIYVWTPSQPGKYTMEIIECQSRRHESYFPYTHAELPDVIWNFGCRTVPGNSGAPLFLNPKATEIEAIHNGSLPLKDVAKTIYEKHDLEQATNARCLFDASRCLVFSHEDRMGRFRASQEAAYAAFDARTLHKNGVEYIAKNFMLEPDQDGNPFHFETYFKPNCRTQTQPLSEITFIFEHAKFEFDEWGKLNPISLGFEEAVASASAIDAINHVATVIWPTSVGKLAAGQTHPRAQGETPISFAIPECAR